MKRTSYGERDHAFGQRMLTLRMTTGLTQAGVAELLGISRRTVGAWEFGSSYPKAEHLKAFIALLLQQQVFEAGQEAQQIRDLWRAARQKVLLDEAWLQTLLQQYSSPTLVEPVLSASDSSFSNNAPRVDWDDALDMSTFYGRQEERALLTEWIVQERCRVVCLLGMGGMGKSALATRVMHQVATQFQVVIWRSLRDAPDCSALLHSCLQVLLPQTLQNLPASVDERMQLLMEQLRTRRVLLVLDNVESLLAEGSGSGLMRTGSEDYARLLRRLGETAHQSCLLLTSREKPVVLVPFEGSHSPVRTLRMPGLDVAACAQLLEERDIAGTLAQREQLAETYHGNPLALKIVSETIVQLFGGALGPFLQQGEVVFGGVRQLLDEHFARLSPFEQKLLFWLAIMREPVSFDHLLAVLNTPRTSAQVLEALEGLGRRSLIERGQRAGTFTLQSVVLEYVTGRLIAEAGREIEQGQLARLVEHGLCPAWTKEYVRQTQERLLLHPLLALLQEKYHQQSEIEARLLWLLDQERGQPKGYGPANLVMLLYVLRGNLRGLDLSHLVLRGLTFQGVEMQDANLSATVLRNSIFTEPLDAIWAIAVSNDGQYWAAASRGGEVRLWAEAGQTLYQVWQAHSANVQALAFSPDSRLLASGGWDNTIKLWEVENSTLAWEQWQTGGINALAFAPDGQLLASAGSDTLIQLWDPHSGTKMKTLAGQGGAVLSLAWKPDGRLLAGGYSDGSIELWEPAASEAAARVHAFKGHDLWVTGLAFAPDAPQLASTSLDGTFKLWNIENFEALHTAEHTDRLLRVAWASDGRTIANCSFDGTIRLWDVKESRVRAVLQGHTALVYALTFTPDSSTLLSGSDDGTLRVWDVDRGQGLRVIGGYTVSLFGMNWSPDGRQIATAGTDSLVTLWDVASSTLLKILHGHRWMVQGVAWSPDGELLASAGYDNSIRLWNPASGVSLYMLSDPEATDTLFQDVAWSPDGTLLACGSYPRGAQMWDVSARTRLWVGQKVPTLIRRVAWSLDGTRLAGGSDDASVYIWDYKDGTELQKLTGHTGVIMCVAWNSDGTQIISAGSSKEEGELFLWDVQSATRLRVFQGHPGVVSEVVWSPQGDLIISGGSDGKLRWWDVESGALLRVQEGHEGTVHSLKISPDGEQVASCGDDGTIQLWHVRSGRHIKTLRRDRLYERLDITDIKGLSDAQKESLHALGAFERR